MNTRPDVILVYSARVLNAMRQATQNIPVVFLATSDPVGLGLVKSLAHPGGNLTGFILYEVSVAGKLVELLKEMYPALARVGHLFNPDNLQAAGFWGSIESVAPSMGVVPVKFPVRDAPTIQDAIDRFARDRNGGLVLPVEVTTIVYRDLIITLAARHRLPAIYSFHADVAGGGLMSYGPDTPICSTALPRMSTAFSGVRRQPTSQFKRLSSTSWLSTSPPPRRSASTCLRCFSSAPTR